MSSAVWPDRDTGMRPGDLHRPVIVRDRRADLLPVSPRAEHGVRGDERNLAHRRHSARDRRHVLLGDAELDEPIRKFLLEGERLRALREVAREHDDERTGFASANEAVTEAATNRNLFDVVVEQM